MNAIKKLAGMFVLTLGACPIAAMAASPALEIVVPRGAQRGTEVDVTFRGGRLTDAQEVLLYQPGITVSDLKVEGGNVKAKFKIAADAKLGEHTLRLRTATGISELRNFFVGAYPEVAEVTDKPAADPKQPPVKVLSSFDKPQEIGLNVTVTGLTELEQQDFYAVEMKQGQRLTVEVEGMRLGEIFDTHVTIYDTSRFELATSDDNALLRQDAMASVLIPRDGRYIIQVRESSYGGGPKSFYRMHVGHFPRPRAVYPAGGKAGEEMSVKFIGDVKGPFDQKVKVPATPGEIYPLFAEQDGLMAPSANTFRVSDFGNVLEAEPNDEVSKATAHDGALPIAFNGIIEKEDDVDHFKFKATKGQVVDINVYGRRVRSPLDPVLSIHKTDGSRVADNDDSGGPDSYFRFNPPADGEYVLAVRDHLKSGGPSYVYRVELTFPAPSLTLAIPNMGVNYTQDRQTIVVPRGGRYGTTLRGTRQEFQGDVKLIAENLPAGVTMHAEPLPQGNDTWAVVFEAAPDAKVGGTMATLTAKCLDEKVNVAGQFKQVVELSQGGNNAPYYTTTATKLAVAVADEAPYTVSVVQPKVPVVQNGVMDLKVKVERKGEFKGPVNVKLLWDPPGVGSGTITIAPDKTEGILPVNAQANARAAKWKTALVANSDIGGQLWTSSSHFDLEVGLPFVAATIERNVVEQGQETQMVVKLDQKVPFDGQAKIELLGLPSEATAAEKQISKDDKQVIFDIKTTGKTPAGNHNGLLCKVTVTKDGEPIAHNVGQGGILRVDAAKVKPKEDGKPAAAAAKPADPNAPPLSRLEKLRQEAEKK